MTRWSIRFHQALKNKKPLINPDGCYVLVVLNVHLLVILSMATL